MTEEKTTTATKMHSRTSILAMQKLKENDHKKDLLKMPLEKLLERMQEEIAEFNKAYRIYERNPTLKNKNAMDLEAGDVLNFMSAIIAKTDGYDHLIRE